MQTPLDRHCRTPGSISTAGGRPRRAVGVLMAPCLLLAACVARADDLPRYRYKLLPAGTAASTINRLGEMVVESFEDFTITIKDRQVSGATAAGSGASINRHGDVAYTPPSLSPDDVGIVRFADGSFVTLEAAYTAQGYAIHANPTSLSDFGRVVGTGNYLEGASAGVVWSDSGYLVATCLTPLWTFDPHSDPCRDTVANDISEIGIIVGGSTTEVDWSATYWFEPDAPMEIAPGDAVAIGGNRWIAVNHESQTGVYDLFTEQMIPLGSGESRDVNKNGWVVGAADGEAVLWMVDNPGVRHRLVDLLDWEIPPTPDLEQATRINDCGVIIGLTGSTGWTLAPIDSTDTDGDGLFDLWEECGVDSNADGLIDLQLRNADPERKDLFVELDAMAEQVPSVDVLQDVVSAFANAPVANPTGPSGITLHFVGQTMPYKELSGCDPCVDETDISTVPWGLDYPTQWAAVANDRFGSPHERVHPNWDNIELAKAGTHRYGMFIDSFEYIDSETGQHVFTSGGWGEFLGNEFAVAMGSWTDVTREDRSSTLMHELGHTLGLNHGGAIQADGSKDNYKPNYKSVMNYTWAVPAHRWTLADVPDPAMDLYTSSWRLDYSQGGLAILDENSLNDGIQGLGGSTADFVPIGVPLRPPLDGTGSALISMGAPVDWAPAAAGGFVASNVNYLALGAGGYLGAPDSLDVLADHDDWSALALLPNHTDAWWSPPVAAKVSSSATNAGASGIAHCITYDEALALSELKLDCNANGIADQVEIASGGAADVDANGIPDECERWASHVRDEPPGVPDSAVSVLGVHPNPFNPRTEVSFGANAGSVVDVDVLDVRGTRVANLFSGVATGLRQAVIWSADELPSGVYFVRVESHGRSATEKVVLLR